MRLSGDTLAADRSILNGFDYSLQVWVMHGLVQPCGHPDAMRQHGPCCNAARYHGYKVATISGHERREQ